VWLVFFRSRECSSAPANCLDASKYYLILPDQRPCGGASEKSTKPSDGLRCENFHTTIISDMGPAHRRFFSHQGLQVNHLHLFVGRVPWVCMEGFLWAESNPDDMDAMFSAFLPAGGGRQPQTAWSEKIMVDDIRLDPGWNNGKLCRANRMDCAPRSGTCSSWGSGPHAVAEGISDRRGGPTNSLDQYIEQNMKTTDANDFIVSVRWRPRNYDCVEGPR